MSITSELHINLAAATENYRRVVTTAGTAEVAAVVKADAYGLGAEALSPALFAAGCRQFFVATLAEAIRLRPHIPQGHIAVLEGVWKNEEKELLAHNLIPVLNDLAHVARWKQTATKAGKKLPAILHCDTGMQRLGLRAREVEKIADDPALLDGIDLQLIMSHLACAEDHGHPLNDVQLQRFEALKPKFPAVRYSLANSAGMFIGAPYVQDMVRTGAALYGVNPTPGEPSPVKCVVTLRAPIISLAEVTEKTSVGYGATVTVPAGTRLAVVAAGYADGFMRAAGNGGKAFFNGHFLPIVGRVSMDMVTLDISALPPEMLHPGAMVELIGPNCTIDQIAKNANTIGYEILTRLGTRPKRYYDGHN